MIFKKKILLVCFIAILPCLNFTACSKENNKSAVTSKAITQELSDANIELFCKVGITDSELAEIKNKLENHESVSVYKLVSKEELTKKAGKLLGSEKLLEGENANILPISFIIKLKDASMADSFYNEFKADSRIDKILKKNKEDRVKK